MKIGIVTQPLKTNYGGNLQNYALQVVLKELGFNPITLDWASPKISFSRGLLGNLKTTSLHIIGKGERRELLLSEIQYSLIANNFLEFQKKYIVKTPIIRSSEDFKKEAEHGNYAAFITGSDQVWRKSYNYFSQEMFLSFTKDLNVKRLSYAASFGNDQWEFSPDTTKKYSEMVSKFDLVTVREQSGIDLCKNHLGVNAHLVLDPTLLLDQKDYINLVDEEQAPKSKGNLFCYLLDSTRYKQNFVEIVANRTGFTPFEILPKYRGSNLSYFTLLFKKDDCRFPSIAAWLRSFIDSNMTIVDSFHGMVFSVIFNKPFWVIGNIRRGNTRFDSFLDLIGLKNRLINDSNINSIDIMEPIDWDAVNNLMRIKKEESINLLSEVLRNDE